MVFLLPTTCKEALHWASVAQLLRPISLIFAGLRSLGENIGLPVITKEREEAPDFREPSRTAQWPVSRCISELRAQVPWRQRKEPRGIDLFHVSKRYMCDQVRGSHKTEKQQKCIWNPEVNTEGQRQLSPTALLQASIAS